VQYTLVYPTDPASTPAESSQYVADEGGSQYHEPASNLDEIGSHVDDGECHVDDGECHVDDGECILEEDGEHEIQHDNDSDEIHVGGEKEGGGELEKKSDEEENLEEEGGDEVEYDDVSIGTPLPHAQCVDLKESKATQSWISDFNILQKALKEHNCFSFFSLGHGYTVNAVKSIQYAKDLDELKRLELMESLQQKQIFIGMTASKNLPRRESVKV
jgi:hypothetical protein